MSLGGNDVGKLLGWRAAERAAAGQQAATGSGAPTLATSLVSSPALSKVAEGYGIGYAETQTGFKWISRAPGLVFGYEEALGYLVNPESVRDKDGVSAAVAILEMAGTLAASGKALWDLDDEFSERFGSFASTQASVRFEDVTEIPRVMAALRAALPTEVAGAAVTEATDLAALPDEASRADIVRLRLSDGTRVMVRPSGTEPKIKCYVDAVATEGSAQERRAAASETAARVAKAMDGVLRGL